MEYFIGDRIEIVEKGICSIPVGSKGTVINHSDIEEELSNGYTDSHDRFLLAIRMDEKYPSVLEWKDYNIYLKLTRQMLYAIRSIDKNTDGSNNAYKRAEIKDLNIKKI